ncbi:hypothetical protein CRG98_039710, partial [Punica granatum]
VYPVLLDPGNLPALDLRVVKWQVATPSHVRPSRVPGKVDTPKPRLFVSPWRKGEGREWPARESGHDSPIMRGGWPGWTTSGHSTSRHGEVKTMSGLPAKVGTTRLSYGVGGRAG